MFPEETFEYKDTVRVDLGGARQLLAEVRKRRIYFHSIEVHEIDEDGYWIPRLEFCKKGLSGEDEFTTLEQHYSFDEDLLNMTEQAAVELKFEIWLNPESGLPSKDKP
jgi:hypothetical protein